MGMITITVAGSFGRKNGSRNFSALKHGHADAVAQAIQYLAEDVLPFATALDHQLHSEGENPSHGFERVREEEYAQESGTVR